MSGEVNKTEASYKCLGWRVSRSAAKRYFAMVNICFLGLGAFISFDSVGALQQALMDKFNISFSEFSLMYSVNAWANVIISPFGGFLIDRVFGIRFGTIFYSVIFIIGHVVFSSGVTVVSFWCALLGRFLNGVGHEFIYICLQLYSVYYFKGKELSMIMCTNISIARLGSSLVYTISDPLLTHIRQVAPGSGDVGIVLFIVGSFMSLTLVSGVILMIMTPKDQTQSDETTKTMEKEQQTNAHPKMKLKDLVIWPLEFWLITCIQLSFCVAIYVFLPFTQELFKTVSGLTVEKANQVTSFFSIIGAVISPFIGLLIDRTGKEIYFCHAGFLTGFLAHVILGWTTWTPYFSMFVLSLSYGIFNGSVMPMMAFIIPDYKLGTAYGVSLMFLNGGYALCVFLVGLTVDKFRYVGLAVFMICSLGIGALASIWLMIHDKKRRGILNVKACERKAVLSKNENESQNKDESALPLKNSST